MRSDGIALHTHTHMKLPILARRVGTRYVIQAKGLPSLMLWRDGWRQGDSNPLFRQKSFDLAKRVSLNLLDLVFTSKLFPV
jgi:hypothetical protein